MAVLAFGFVAMPLLKNNRNAILLIVAVTVPLLAAGLYLQLGSPDVTPSQQHSTAPQRTTGGARTNADASSVGSVASMVDGLASRLRDNPEDGGNWLLLAKSYKYLNRIDEAADAYAKAAALGQYDAELAKLGSATGEPSTSSGAQITGNVTLSPEAADIVLPTDAVFIFAKAVNGPAAPLAVLRLAVADLPSDFLLNDSQSMIAGMKLSNFDEVVVTARITRGGDATTALKGLEARSDTILVAENEHLNLTIK